MNRSHLVPIAALCAALATLHAPDARAQARPADVSARAEREGGAHPVILNLRLMLEHQLSPTERRELAAVDLDATATGGTEDVLLAMLDHLRPAVVGALDAVGHRSREAGRVRGFEVRERADATALGAVLEAAAAAAECDADADESTPVDAENPLRVAAALTRRAAELATTLGGGVSDEDEPAIEDALLEVVTLLDGATALVGRPQGVRLALQLVRGAAAAARGPTHDALQAQVLPRHRR